MNIIVTGATGMVGAELVRQALADASIVRITLLVRRPSPFNHPKIRQVLHKDFTNYSGLDDIFRENDACIWCLGISQSRVSKKEYNVITYDYTVAAAKAMSAANPKMVFIFLSGEGADSKEKSRILFARVKGKAENALLSMGLHALYIFRPGGIEPTTRSADESRYKKFEIFMVKAMAALLPWTVVDTKQLSLVMLRVAKEGYAQSIIHHKAIKNFVF